MKSQNVFKCNEIDILFICIVLRDHVCLESTCTMHLHVLCMQTERSGSLPIGWRLASDLGFPARAHARAVCLRARLAVFVVCTIAEDSLGLWITVNVRVPVFSYKSHLNR